MDRPAVSTPDQTAPKQGELVSIQYLRAAAAFAVLVFHVTDRVGWRFGAGAAGVDVFFVISGFIMWVIGARGSPSPASFLTRRAERIVPLYWAVTLLLVLFWALAPGLFRNLQPTPSHVVLSLLFVPHADPSGLVAPLVEPGWTLNFEIFFYLVFAASLLAPRARQLSVLTASLILLVGLGVVLRPASPVLSTYSSPLLLEFLAGVWIGWLWKRGGLSPSPLASAAMLVAGIGLIALWQALDVDIAPWRVLAWGAPSILIVCGALGLERSGRLAQWRPARFLGDASYSIYLTHGLVVAAMLKLIARFDAPPTLLVVVMTSLACLAAGGVCYVLFERPVTSMLHQRRQKLRLGLPTAYNQSSIK